MSKAIMVLKIMCIGEELKDRAKGVLKQSYWKALVVSFILFLVGANEAGGSSGGRADHNTLYNTIGNNDYMTSGMSRVINGVTEFMPAVIRTLVVLGLYIGIVVICYRILIGYAVEVGGRKYFKQATQYDINMGYLGYSFNKEHYWDIIKTMLYRSVLNFLWYLLLIIPGIVASYAYSMVPYILADNPNIGYKRAVELSNQMTNGEKFDMFVLDLSFIGWYLLGALLFGLGVFFVNPYADATNAELYIVLRRQAIERGHTNKEELQLTAEES